ncbi:MAG: S9 family peptidase [Chitinophagaceae bacterium]|nr:S9 family peptidase [Chitinophagaceae bacterium]
MRSVISFLTLALMVFMQACNDSKNGKDVNMWNENVKPPVAPVQEHIRVVHGDTVPDNYYWMIDYFRKGPGSSKVIQYLTEENTYLDSMMSDTRSLRDELYAEMKGRIKEKDESVPVFKNGYYYYTRTEEGKQYFKYCRKKETLEAPEEILLDVDEMAGEHSYFSVTGFTVSPDNKLLAFGVDTVSRRQYAIHIKNLETGALYKDQIPGTSGRSVWANDNQTLFYTYNNPETLLSEKIKRHRLNTEVKEDAIVYEEKDPANYIEVVKSKRGNYIFIMSEATLSSEIRYIPANEPNREWRVFQPRMRNVLYRIDEGMTGFYIVTNWDAKNFRLMECPSDHTDAGSWKELIAHRTDVLLEGIDVFRDYMVIRERKDGLVRLRVRNISSQQEYYIDFEEAAYGVSLAANPEFYTDEFRYVYSSLITPGTTYDYNLKTKEKKLMKQQEVLGGYAKEDYSTERLYATARDGSKIPVSLVYKKGFSKNGRSPLLLYGYGSYGVTVDPVFNSNRLSLLNRGFTFAIAHIRGGEDLGRQWYEDGKMMKKKNTFTDFIDCGEFLIKEKYCSAKNLYAQGGSAGGLLMGAVINMAPDLWNGVVAQVPFVDVVNTMLDSTIPLTTNEYDEWGNPEESKAAYEYMKSYSPYENIERKAYPNLLVTTGLHDSQVQYFEPAKWVAKLRAMKTDNHILLLHTNMDFGHGGASGRFDYLKDVALEYAFLLKLASLSK